MLVARRHAGCIALGHVNDAVVGDDGGIVVDRQHAQIVGVIVFQFAVVRAAQDFFLVMKFAFAAHRQEIIGQSVFQKRHILGLLGFRNRFGIGNQRLLQRSQGFGLMTLL